MRKSTKSALLVALVAIVASAFLSLEIRAQGAQAAVSAAMQAMGTAKLTSVEYTATGSTYGFGQAIGPGSPWPRFTITSYTAAINYDAPVMREEIVRIDDEDPPRGGGAGPYNPTTHQGGIRPIPFGSHTQTRQATARTDAGQVQIWMTPHGFLKAAATHGATVNAVPALGAHVVSFTALDRYVVTGTINDRNLVERVETRLPNSILGDMLVEAIYADYRDFGGVQFPTRIIQRQGGYHTLDLNVADVRPNSAASAALQAPEGTPGTGPQPVRLEAERVAAGVWFLSGGNPSTYLIEFSDHVVVIEAPGNDARTEAALAAARRALPNKPIRYVVNTHHHSDHAGGLRRFAAEGITVITHELNKPYYEQLWSTPRLLEPDRLSREGRRPAIEAVMDRRVLSDGTMTVELHHVRGNLHDPAILMAYLPGEKLLIQADAYNPRPPDARPLPGPSPFTVNLLDNIERLQLDVDRILHVHGGVEPFGNLVRAAGRQASQD